MTTRELLDFVSVGPMKAADVRVMVDDGPSRLVCAGGRAYARLLMARQAGGTKWDSKVKESHFVLDEAARRPYPIGKRELNPLLSLAGLNVRMDEASTARLEEHLRRTQARYSRWIPPQEEGMEWTYDPGTIAQSDKDEVDKALKHLGWDREIFPFMYEGLLEMGTKRDALITTPVGSSKTRTSLALADYYKYKQKLTGPTIILGAKRHLFPTWPEEFEKCELIRVMHGEDPYETLISAGDRPTYTKPYLLISVERLSLLSDDQLAELVEAAKNSVIIIDEIYLFARRNSRRSQFLRKLVGANHIGLSGTPSTGFVSSMLHPLQMVFRGGSCALADYPTDREGSEKKFDATFTSYSQSEDGRSRKRVPFLKNETLFHDLIAPLLYRRLRNEPALIKVLGDMLLEEELVEVRLDPGHVNFYLACVKQFSEWYARELHRRQMAGEKVGIPTNEIIVKLGYLIRGVSAPWRMKDPGEGADPALLDGFVWPEYERKPTAIMQAAMDRAIAEVEEGYQVIIFGHTRDPLELMHEEMIKLGAPSMLMHGGIDSNRRPELIRAFRRDDTKIMCASYGVAAEGWNLAAASRVILTEYDWNPSKEKQAIGRITRPDQKYVPRAIRITAPGTVQDYVRKWAALKQDGIDAALDRKLQSSSAYDIPDIQQYAFSLVGYREDPEQIQPRLFDLELESA